MFVRSALAALLVALVLAGPARSVRAEDAESAAPAVYDLRPWYLGTPEIAAAYDLFKAGQAAAACDALGAALARIAPDDPARAPLTFLQAVVAGAAGRWSVALAAYEEARRDPALADRANYVLGRAAARDGDRAAAVEFLVAVGPGGPWWRRAAELLAEQYTALGRRDEALGLLRERIERAPPDQRPDALLALADALVAAGRRGEAREVLERLWREHRGAAAADRAAVRFGRLVRPPSPIERVVAIVANANGHNAGTLLERIRKLRRTMKGREVRTALDYAEGVALVQRRGTRPRGLKLLVRAGRQARSPELTGWVLLAEGEARLQSNEPDEARARLERLVREHPEHPATPSGRLRLARLLSDAGDGAAALPHLEALVEQQREGPLAAPALWWLGWVRWRSGDPAGARAAFEELAARFDRVDSDGASTWGERARYWTGRCLHAEGKTSFAVAAWRDLVRTAPFTWYAHLAWSRLQEHDERAADAADAPAAPDGPGEGHGPGAAPAPAREPGRLADPTASPADLLRLRVHRDPRLDTAVALVRLGLYEDASGELEYRLATGELPPDGLVLAGALRLRTGDVVRAHRLMRRYGRFATPPDECSDAYWKLAYPVPFVGVATEWGRAFGVSPWLVMGLMRHESAFRPDARSYANAIGLMQLLPTTAQSIAARLLQLPKPSARDLRNPALNVLLSTRYLRELTSLFQGNLALAVSAYNAGAGRVKGWLRDRPTLATDEFIELLPYQNTAVYTRRVVAAYTAYTRLYGDPADPLEALGPLPAALPAELGPYMKRDPALLGPESAPEPAPEGPSGPGARVVDEARR